MKRFSILPLLLIGVLLGSYCYAIVERHVSIMPNAAEDEVIICDSVQDSTTDTVVTDSVVDIPGDDIEGGVNDDAEGDDNGVEGNEPEPKPEYGLICRPLDNSIFEIWPQSDDCVSAEELSQITVYLPESICGKLKLNDARIPKDSLYATLIYKPYISDTTAEGDTLEDSSESEDGSCESEDGSGNNENIGNDNSENEGTGNEDVTGGDEGCPGDTGSVNEAKEFRLYPVIDADGRKCEFALPEKLLFGEWKLMIPEGFFEFDPDFVEVEDIDYPDDIKYNFGVAGAWHKSGISWDGTPMFTIQDDDGIDGLIPSSFPARGPTGYYSLLYPILESLGLKGTCSMIGSRIGFTDHPPRLNDNGRIARRLQDEKGWEIQSHSMTCLGELLNNWRVDSLESELAERILHEGKVSSVRGHQNSVYDMKTRRQYEINQNGDGWVESPSEWIKPYIGDYDTKRPVAYNTDFCVDYHWGEWYRLAEEHGIHTKSWVTYNSSASHGNVPEIMKYAPYGFADMTSRLYNVPPVLSTATRFVLEGQALSSYAGENSRDNTFKEDQYKEYIRKIDECYAAKGWIVFGIHAYRWCWINSLPGALVSEGGTYPDEWVEPMKGIDPLTDSLDPPVRLGISDWSEWYPCPGTRAYMAWEILKYARDKGMLNVTSTEGHELIGNRKFAGYFTDGCRIGQDIFNIEGTREIYPHYVEAVTGEEFYYNPLVSDKIEFSFSVNCQTASEMTAVESAFINAVSIDGISLAVSDINELPKGFWIVNGKKVLIK